MQESPLGSGLPGMLGLPTSTEKAPVWCWVLTIWGAISGLPLPYVMLVLQPERSPVSKPPLTMPAPLELGVPVGVGVMVTAAVAVLVLVPVAVGVLVPVAVAVAVTVGEPRFCGLRCAGSLATKEPPGPVPRPPARARLVAGITALMRTPAPLHNARRTSKTSGTRHCQRYIRH